MPRSRRACPPCLAGGIDRTGTTHPSSKGCSTCPAVAPACHTRVPSLGANCQPSQAPPCNVQPSVLRGCMLPHSSEGSFCSQPLDVGPGVGLLSLPPREARPCNFGRVSSRAGCIYLLLRPTRFQASRTRPLSHQPTSLPTLTVDPTRFEVSPALGIPETQQPPRPKVLDRTPPGSKAPTIEDKLGPCPSRTLGPGVFADGRALARELALAGRLTCRELEGEGDASVIERARGGRGETRLDAPGARSARTARCGVDL